MPRTIKAFFDNRYLSWSFWALVNAAAWAWLGRHPINLLMAGFLLGGLVEYHITRWKDRIIQEQHKLIREMTTTMNWVSQEIRRAKPKA